MPEQGGGYQFTKQEEQAKRVYSSFNVEPSYT